MKQFRTFPLIMFVGREPNNDAPCMAEVGLYDFDAAPGCAFWNMAYKILADFGPPGKMTLSDLKNMCRHLKSSPVAFTDISPKPIPRKVLNKAEIRSAIPWQEKQVHLENIFSKGLLKRVNPFFLIGLEGNEFIESKNYFVERCKAQSKACMEIPFSYPLQYSKIALEIEKDHDIKGLIRKAFLNWL